MATINSNLTKLSNARSDIINKLNNTLQYSIPSETHLSQIPQYINATNNFMVDFINMNKMGLNWTKINNIGNRNVDAVDWNAIRDLAYCNIPRDGFLTVYVWLQQKESNWGRLLFCDSVNNRIENLINNPDTLNYALAHNWILVDAAVTHGSWWEGCTLQFNGWVKAGQQIATTCARPRGVFDQYAKLLYY